ncbi:UNVERIFIED_CONTAM: PRA1 family protein B3 [Sesamum latifolium]|uniref:PRA1 family protein n=1 Tax=Sesamum latifolium TaxID=2727402 RepID=A0AAW2XXU5_9LAMI
MSLSPSPALTEHLTRLSDALRRTIARRRPWFELIDVSAFSRPDSLSVAVSRTRKNLSYFRVNYLSILALVLAASLLSHPLSLFALVSLIAPLAPPLPPPPRRSAPRPLQPHLLRSRDDVEPDWADDFRGLPDGSISHPS